MKHSQGSPVTSPLPSAQSHEPSRYRIPIRLAYWKDVNSLVPGDMGHPSSIAPGPSTCLPLVPQSPPPHRARPKSIFSRLRRTAIPMSMSATSHLVQADAIVVPVGVSSNKGKWDKRASRKAPPPPLPPQPHVPSFEEEVVDEVEWDRVRTLPRVRLIPPEEGESTNWRGMSGMFGVG